MKKCKLALVGLLLVLSMGVLVACGNEKNEETGSAQCRADKGTFGV